MFKPVHSTPQNGTYKSRHSDAIFSISVGEIRVLPIIGHHIHVPWFLFGKHYLIMTDNFIIGNGGLHLLQFGSVQEWTISDISNSKRYPKNPFSVILMIVLKEHVVIYRNSRRTT